MIRAIEHAYDFETGERFSISENTNSQEERFALREEVQRKKRYFECIECGQFLTVVVSKKDFIYFRHLPNSEECTLKNASSEEIRLFNELYASKESPRHKFLKNLIGNKLKDYSGITSVQIDDKFIVRGNEKRKPDVYCKFGDKEIVFEIQLSDLSISYLTSRHEFYKKNGIYLIWILDKFDPEKSTQLVRDIKYLNEYQNFFKLDEKSETFKLHSKYKESYVTSFLTVQDKWVAKSVTLDEVTFNNVNYQVFYLDYKANRKLHEEKAEVLKEEKNQAEITEKERILSEQANVTAASIRDEIKTRKDKNGLYFDDITSKISKLSNLELKVLNERLNISGKPSVSKWFSKSDNSQFILFMLKCKGIDLDVNIGFENKSSFQILHENPVLFHESITKEMFKRGYILTNNDKESPTNDTQRYQMIVYEIAEKLELDSDIDQIFESKTNKLIFIIESIKRGQIINSGFKSNDWLAFGNNLTQHYNDYWEYLENALRHFEIWNKIIEMDKKGTFQNKVDLLKFDFPKQKTEFKTLFDKIYPELK
ncbi:DUF6035 family protein [Fluviicola sp.]|uniref:DUF6035 family protein n=1 Tax=Fluviicola sp. TaxID=1917219 RepID=UPI0028309430|nr:DUF6035 family protein [Fluviicola sp.]MDR0803058.1 DUF6035 family protein [Fluviicola sp.]